MQTVSSHISLFIIITTAIVFLLAILIVTLLYLYQKRQIAYDNNVNNLKLDFERNLLKTQIEIQEQTFDTISKEIHDNISLSLTLAKLNLNTLPWVDIPETRNSVDASISLIGTSISQLNDLSKTLSPEVIGNIGLTKSIKIEVEKIVRMAHLKIEYTVKGEPIFLSCEKELIIFRIIQESFNNIIKHAKASRVLVELNYCDHFLDILVKDNGIGFIRTASKPAGAGIHNMQTRVKSFGGRFLLETKPNKGTQILITVPYY
jgi:two-component system, NarL family, sensor kinase